jgi:hypothetical protein
MTITTIIIKLEFLGMLLTMSALVQGFVFQPRLTKSSISKLYTAGSQEGETRREEVFFTLPQPAANKKKPEVKPVKKPLLGGFVVLLAKPQNNWTTMKPFEGDDMGYASKRLNWLVKPKTDEPNKKKKLATSSISKRTQLTAAKKGKPEEKPKFMFSNFFSPPQPAANKKKLEVKPVKKPLLGGFVVLLAKPQNNWQYFDKDNYVKGIVEGENGSSDEDDDESGEGDDD